MTKITRNKTRMAYLQCLYSSAKQNHLERTHARFFRNSPKNSANSLRVSTGTRPKIPRDSRAFLQERDQEPREILARVFRNATKTPRNTRAFLQERAQKLRETLVRFFRNATKNPVKYSRVSSGTRTRLHETLTRFFRNAPKNSTRHSRVSSGTRQKTP